jgi:hypothetical protein
MQQHVLRNDPTSAGPLKALAPRPTTAEDARERLTAHCVSCGDKRDFAVEGEEVMKNGAVRKYGTCDGDTGCGGKISTFVSSKESKRAA